VFQEHTLDRKTAMQVAEWTVPGGHASLVLIPVGFVIFTGLEPERKQYPQRLAIFFRQLGAYAEHKTSIHKTSTEIPSKKRKLTRLLHPKGRQHELF